MKLTVVGGGPVGLFAACAAAHAGLDVTVIEKRSGTPDKACGEGLMPAALTALHEIDVEPEGVDFRGIRYLNATGEWQAHATLAHGHGRGVRRTALVSSLQDKAQSLGVRQVTTRVVAHAQLPGSVNLDCADGTAIDSDVVLACDGLASDLRRQAGLETVTRGPARFGLRQHFSSMPWSDDVEVYWGEHGEAYVTPVAQDLVGVALLGARQGTFESRLTAFPALNQRLGSAHAVGPVLGAGPMRRRAKHPLRDRVLLVGDAAGYVDALTGEGLAVGFLSAQAAVAAVIDGDLQQYSSEWHRVTRRFRWSTEALLRATSRRASRSALMPLAGSLPSVFERAVRAMT